MKLTDIQTFVAGNPPPHYGGRYFVFVKLTTDGNVHGVGEAYCLPFHPDLVARMLEDVFADQPTDVGASITTVAGKFSRATILRFRILDGVASDLTVTRRIGEILACRDLLEPWQLKFDIAGRSIEVPNLFIVRQGAFETGMLSPVLEELGAPAAIVLGLHRISLFRAGALLAAARMLLEPPPLGSADGQAHRAA